MNSCYIFSQCSFLFFKDAFIYMFERQDIRDSRIDIEREGYQPSSGEVTHYPNGYLSKNWARPKPKIMNSIQISHVVAGAQQSGPSSIALLDILAGIWVRSRATRTQTCAQRWASSTASGGLTHCTTTPPPIL